MSQQERDNVESVRRARDRGQEEARLRAMQAEQIVFEGAAPKGRVGLVSAWVVSTIAMFLPLKVRTALTFGLNFVYNHVWATLRLIVAWIGRALFGVALGVVYFLVLGPTAIVQRLFGRDDLHSPEVGGSFFTDKDPQDDGEARFLRQY